MVKSDIGNILPKNWDSFSIEINISNTRVESISMHRMHIHRYSYASIFSYNFVICIIFSYKSVHYTPTVRLEISETSCIITELEMQF